MRKLVTTKSACGLENANRQVIAPFGKTSVSTSSELSRLKGDGDSSLAVHQVGGKMDGTAREETR